MSDLEDALKDMRETWASVSESPFGGCILHPSHVDQINKNFAEMIERAEKAEARVKELEDKFERVNAVRTLALIKFGNEPVPRRVDGVLEFPTFKVLDKEMMEKGDE